MDYQFSQLEYVPTDYEALQKEVNAFLPRISAAQNADELEECILAFEKQVSEATYSETLAMIHSYLDGSDEFWQQAAAAERTGSAMLDTASIFQTLLKNPCLADVEKNHGDQLRNVLSSGFAIAQAGYDQMAREQELMQEFQQIKSTLRIPFRGELCSEADMRRLFNSLDRQTRIEAREALARAVLEKKEELAAILLELISLRDQIARANGFVNYLEYANTRFGRYGYGEKEMTAFCQQVKEEIVPLLEQLHEQQRLRLGLDELMTYDADLLFPDGNARPTCDADGLLAQAAKMFHALHPELGAFLADMVKTESVNILPSENKAAGIAFCIDLKDGMNPFVFGNCNGTSQDVTGFVHEMGHAWQSYLTKRQVKLQLLREMPLDALEIPSKTMEMFAVFHAELFFGENAEKFRYEKFVNTLDEIAGYCMNHEIDTWIYTHVGAGVDEIASEMQRLKKEYGYTFNGGVLEPLNAQGWGLLSSMGIYNFPRYVISYALSQMCAMDLYRLMAEDPQQAWNAYEKLCRQGGSRSYAGILAQAGLDAAYAPGRVRKVAEYVKSILNL